tara:strand:- start:463 stop:723 length:261 start_codon:yes stop_codon:yes gene_type:complete
MIYQLPNGRVIEMSVEQYLDLSDNDISELVGLGPAYSMDPVNPFFRPFSKKTKQRDPELDHEVEPDLTDIKPEDKMDDKLFHRDDT